MVEPAILKAVQGVEQRHVEEAHHLSNGIDREEANNHTLQGHTENVNMSSHWLILVRRDLDPCDNCSQWLIMLSGFEKLIDEAVMSCFENGLQ